MEQDIYQLKCDIERLENKVANYEKYFDRIESCLIHHNSCIEGLTKLIQSHSLISPDLGEGPEGGRTPCQGEKEPKAHGPPPSVYTHKGRK